MQGLGVLNFYKLYDTVHTPVMATIGSACFDLVAHLIEGEKLSIKDSAVNTVNDGVIVLSPWARALIPTGIIFDVPEGHSLRIHPRSGLSFEQGLCLTNQEGIIDSDYKEEVFVSMFNASSSPRTIANGQRIAQAELRVTQMYLFREVLQKPEHTTDRRGGFGSTGSN